MVVVLLAEGFEEIEALTPVDMLRRAGIKVLTASIGTDTAVRGAHGITVVADTLADGLVGADIDMLVLPGGMPGALNLDASKTVDTLVTEVYARGARLAAICAAPLVLGRRGLLRGKRAVCYPGFEGELVGADISSDGVVTDGSITTAKGMGAALPFAKELVALLSSKEKADALANGICES